jgi:peptide/nickel transport system ATP-binding protein
MAESGGPLLQAENLARYFDVSPPLLNRVIEGAPRAVLKAVDGVSFEIGRGETFSLVGESGCGKSTIARLIVGLYEPTAGAIRFDGVEIGAGAPKAERRRVQSRMQMIFQDPYASLNPRWRVAGVIAEPMRAKGREARGRAEALLVQVGLAAADADKYPHEFSGGQRQRISIARALAGEPEFLVCDEPTSALDVSVQAQILNLMKDLQRRFGLTYLFISHDLAVVYHVSTRVGVMYLGRIVEEAATRELFRRPLHPYTRMLLDAIPDLEMSGRARTPVAGEVPSPINPPSGCPFHPRCPHANDRCRSERPAMVERDGARVACHAVEEGRIG